MKFLQHTVRPGRSIPTSNQSGLTELYSWPPTSSTAVVFAMLRTRGTDRTAIALRALSRSTGRRAGHSTRGVGVEKTSPRDNHSSPTSTAAETHATTGPVPGQTQEQSSQNSSSSIDLEALQNRLKHWSVLANSSLRQRADHLSKKATTTFSDLGLHLNRVTGYEEIEALKRQVVEQGKVL